MLKTNEIVKKGINIESLEINDDELELINKLAIEPLTKEQIFTYKVALCNNAIDRDYEVFPISALETMATLFIGKTFVKDHNPKTDNQIGRIYATELKKDENNIVNETGEEFTQLIAKCYMIKSEKNDDLISEIKAGIKKEVSISCSVQEVTCSVCGANQRKGICEHKKGQEYKNKKCFYSLKNPTDAYEVSFVAIPAQPQAGVTKKLELEKEQPLEKVNENLLLKFKKNNLLKNFMRKKED